MNMHLLCKLGWHRWADFGVIRVCEKCCRTTKGDFWEVIK